MSVYEAPISAQDELTHTPEGADGWRENWWLYFSDPVSGVRGVAYCGVQPGMEKGFVMFAAFKDDRPLYVLDNDAVPPSEFDHQGGLVGPMHFRCDEPLARWTVTVDHPQVQATLLWEAAHAAYDWNVGAMGSRHFEQPGRVTGTLTIGDDTYVIDGWGQRDRAWGHRANHAIRTAWSSRVIFGDGDLQHAAIIGLGDETYLFGYRVKDGEAKLIDRLSLSPSYAYAGGPPVSTELRAYSGEVVIADQQVRLANVVPRLTVANGIETHQFFTFSEFYEGATGTVGQMDHWWSTAYAKQDVFDESGNTGEWVTL